MPKPDITINSSAQGYAELDYENDLSPTTEGHINDLIRDLKSKKVSLCPDEDGKFKLQYAQEDGEDVRLKSQKKNRSHIDKSKTNVIVSGNNEQEELDHIAALLESLNFIKENRSPSGVCLDKDKISVKYDKYVEGKDFVKTGKVLGEGNTAGKIYVVKDVKLDQQHALKTMMIATVRPEEIRMWVDLGGEDFVPSLYLVRLDGNRIHFHMEELKRVITVRDVIDNHIASCGNDIKSVSLCMLHGLLTAVNKMHKKNWTHGDLHPGNALVQENDGSIDLKIIDFGLARNIMGGSNSDGLEGMKKDLTECFRMFCGLYLGYEFDSVHDVIRNGRRNLEEILNIYDLEEEARKEILQLYDMFLDVVDYRSEHFGDGEKVLTHVEGILAKNKIDKEEILQSAALRLFPELMEVNMESTIEEHEDNVDSHEASEIRLDSNSSTASNKFIEDLRNEISINPADS